MAYKYFQWPKEERNRKESETISIPEFPEMKQTPDTTIWTKFIIFPSKNYSKIIFLAWSRCSRYLRGLQGQRGNFFVLFFLKFFSSFCYRSYCMSKKSWPISYYSRLKHEMRYSVVKFINIKLIDLRVNQTFRGS